MQKAKTTKAVLKAQLEKQRDFEKQAQFHLHLFEFNRFPLDGYV